MSKTKSVMLLGPVRGSGVVCLTVQTPLSPRAFAESTHRSFNMRFAYRRHVEC